MRVQVEWPRSAPTTDVLALLHSPATWADWVPGVVRVAPAGDAVVVDLHAAVPRTLQLAPCYREDGLDLALERGPLPALTVEIRVADAHIRCMVAASLPGAVPGPLVREMERHVLPSMLDRLDERAGAVAQGAQEGSRSR